MKASVKMHRMALSAAAALLLGAAASIAEPVTYELPEEVAQRFLICAHDLARDPGKRAQAEAFRLGYSELPQDPWNSIIPSGLLAAEEYVANHPGNGFPFGRREGWCLDAVAAAYATQDDAWRNRTRPWVLRIVGVLEANAEPEKTVWDADLRALC